MVIRWVGESVNWIIAHRVGLIFQIIRANLTKSIRRLVDKPIHQIKKLALSTS